MENLLNKYYHHDESLKQKKPLFKSTKVTPWLTYPAIEYLSQFNLRQYQVFEWGTGYSYEWYLSRVKCLTSVESNRKWHRKFLPHKNDRFNPIYSSFKDYPNEINHFSNSFDIIIIDGERRFDCAKQVLRKFDSRMLIILDNSDWFNLTAKLLRENLEARQVDFHGFGPQAPITWTTSFFFGNNFSPPLLHEVQPLPSAGSSIVSEEEIIKKDHETLNKPSEQF